MATTDAAELVKRVPVVRSAAAGIGAYLASFVAIAVLIAATEEGDDLVGVTGNLLYSAHFVDSTIDVSTILFTDTRHQNLLAEGYTELPAFVYYAVPIVVLLAVGIGLAHTLAIEDPAVAALTGAATAIGYVVPTVAGTYVFEFQQDIVRGGYTFGEATAAPELGVSTVLVMGLCYPIVFGGVGGAIGSQLS